MDQVWFLNQIDYCAKRNMQTVLVFVLYFVLTECGSSWLNISVNEDQTETNPYVEALRERPWNSTQHYVEVRPGAHLLYWLWWADGSRAAAEQKPLIIWLQGGPGLAASGVANFAEIGPLKMDMTPRNHTWVNRRNLLLIDHPVGTGFSYVTDESLLVKTDRDMAMDIVTVIKTFLKRHKKFRNTPTYLIGQSYGGKIAPRVGYYLSSAIQKKRLRMNLKGIAIGSGWVDPKESTLVQPDYLYYLGIIDQPTYHSTKKISRQMASLIERKQYITAQALETALVAKYARAFPDLNFNHVAKASPYPALDQLVTTVNRYVKPTLDHLVNQSIQWNYLSNSVWDALKENFLAPSNTFLELLLNNTNLKITVYNGNMDVVTPLAGASNWVHKLKWNGARQFSVAQRMPIAGERNGFYKVARQLSFWWVFGAGHWVPDDNPEAMEHILEHITMEKLSES